MAFLEETLPASYGGIPFLMSESRIAGGRKKVVNQFPNSNKQTVEDLGLIPRSYEIQAIISQDVDGSNYKPKRDALLRVLESGSNNVFIHPFYGRISDVVTTNFTLIETFGDVGVARFNISLEINNDPGTPTISGDTLSQIETGVSNAISAINTDVANNFEVSTIFPSNFGAAVDKVNSIVDEFRNNTSFLQVAADEINSFSLELSSLSSNITSLVSQPQNLVDSVLNLFQTVNGMYTSVDATFEVMQKFFGFGSEDQQTPIIQNTAGRIERARNQNLLNNLVRSSSLVLNYSNAAQIDFTTVSQVEYFENILETQFQAVVSGTIPNADGTVTSNIQTELDPLTLDTIKDLRNEVQAFFNTQKLSASRVIEIFSPQIPSAVLSYNYYGDSTRGASLASLNEDMNSAFLERQLKVFTE